MMRLTAILILATFLFAACAEHDVVEMEYESVALDQAVAVIHSTEGNSVEGTVVFTREDDGVRIHAEISGLDENGTHGFHIHEYGDCRASDATSAGGHFNPAGAAHGGPDHDERHVGDLGNLQADENGVATLEFTDHKVQLGGIHSVLGLAVIVHEQRDDLESQPVGDAGGRIGCGIIGVANPDY
jgi:superoxide dismutase, Cu-Zn family